MRIEHVAFQMADPVAAAAWYVDNLGFTLVRGMSQPPYAHFLMAPGADVMYEIYHNPAAPVPDYPSLHPAALHFAFQVDDVAAEVARLVTAGCTIVTDTETLGTGDTLAMLRDPWGVPVQILRRAAPMIE